MEALMESSLAKAGVSRAISIRTICLIRGSSFGCGRAASCTLRPSLMALPQVRHGESVLSRTRV